VKKPQQNTSQTTKFMRRNYLFCLGLAIITLASFWGVGRLGFIIYDDWDYVYKNPAVLSGINFKSIQWAFTTAHSSNWHPLTWLSHMLDCRWFGLHPGGHHWVNLGFHAANTLLLYLVLWEMTGARWRSFLVAALFACHPMHIQSVAWISERKDVLSGFFAMLTLWAYARYVKKSKVQSPKSKVFYGLALVFFALGLMSKPMLVTLPVIMLLLDFWPLNRWRTAIPDKQKPKSNLAEFIKTWRPLIVEKIPMFLLCLASCVVTFWAQRSGNSVISLDQIAWQDRHLHAVLSYSLYLGKMFWPVNLAIFYPYTPMEPDEFVCLFLLPILLSIICLWRWRAQPYLLAGWFWFVITLVPVIGLVQVGMQSMADRYTYLPSIGLFIAVAWGMAEIAVRSKLWRTGMAWGGIILVSACLLDTRHQLRFWRNNITLFTHVVEVTRENNFVGYFFLGNSYGEAGDLDGAAKSFESALEVAPRFKEARGKLGYVLLFQKKYEAAASQFSEIIRLHPANIFAHEYLGHALVAEGKYAEAQAEYQAALQLMPDDADLQTTLAANTQKIQASQTLAGLNEILKTNSTPEIHVQVAVMQTILGDYPEAVEHDREALRLNPDSPDGLNNLAWLLATCPDAKVRDGARAVELAEHACQLTQFKATVFLGTLAAAYAEAGRFNDATTTAQKACALASAAGEKELLKRNQELLALYQSHQPYHERPAKVIPAVP
jgi:tetratricopeptide (TPR) repeat protein